MPTYTWIADEVFTVDELLTPEECEQYIELSESLGYGDAPINSSFGPVHMPELRNNQRVMLDDTARGEELWSRIREYVPVHRGEWTAIGVNERLRFYRYDVGQQFDWHYDGYFQRDNGERSFLTYMIYLNGNPGQREFVGGETSFAHLKNASRLIDGKVVPKAGRALLFDHPMLHKGDPVTKGRKYVLRTDVMYQRTEEVLESK